MSTGFTQIGEKLTEAESVTFGVRVWTGRSFDFGLRPSLRMTKG